jgi:transcriptional regulator with XRE-family HTH domain
MNNDRISGAALKRARLQAGLSQQELADKIGVQQPYISSWETEKTVPNSDQLKKLRRVIDLEIDSEAGPSAIGAWLTRVRTKRGLSIAELAEKAGLSLPTVYNIESGRSPNPHESTIKKLERALNDKVPTETADEAKAEATIEGVGELLDFDPHEQDEWPNQPGVYVLTMFPTDRSTWVRAKQSSAASPIMNKSSGSRGQLLKRVPIL